jgi:N-acetylneuraminate synthase
VAEIGINHNGSIDTAHRLIVAAAAAGCDAVKFQKRTVDIVYTPEELAKPRESVFGSTNGDLKRGLEFGPKEYEFLAACCREHGLQWFASCWDEASVDLIQMFDPPAYKIASASLTDLELVRHTAATGKPILLSTGMSTLPEVDAAVQAIRETDNPLVLLHCVSTYPSDNAQLNLRCIPAMRDHFNELVGYSGHEKGLATTLAAVAIGACVVERHITLDRTMWGSDQAASLEPHALCRLVRDIRAVEAAMGDGVKRVLKEEEPIAAKLRRVA